MTGRSRTGARRPLLPLIVLVCIGTAAGRSSAQPFSFDDRARARLAAEYILSCQMTSGAIRDAHDNPYVNMDNNMGYALAALAAAAEAFRDVRYLDAVARGLAWMAARQEPDGAWHWGYAGATGLPYVSDAYRRRGLDGIRGVDAIQAYFAVSLHRYARGGGDDAVVRELLPTARRGVDYLLEHNEDDGVFASSWQRRGGRWTRLAEAYSAGQGDVYLGLTAMWHLSGDPRYGRAARRVRMRLDEFLDDVGWMESLRRPWPYRFSNGYLPWIFQRPEGLPWLAAHQDGAAMSAAALALGAQATSAAPSDAALARLAAMQERHGGVRMKSWGPYREAYYTNDAAFALLAWLRARPALDPLDRLAQPLETARERRYLR